MLTLDNIRYIELSLLESDIDIILDALQLYAFNFHKVWPVERNSDFEQCRNYLIKLLYDRILSKRYDNKYSHKEYNVIDGCKDFDRKNKIKEFYQKKKKFA